MTRSGPGPGNFLLSRRHLMRWTRASIRRTWLHNFMTLWQSGRALFLVDSLLLVQLLPVCRECHMANGPLFCWPYSVDCVLTWTLLYRDSSSLQTAVEGSVDYLSIKSTTGANPRMRYVGSATPAPTQLTSCHVRRRFQLLPIVRYNKSFINTISEMLQISVMSNEARIAICPSFIPCPYLVLHLIYKPQLHTKTDATHQTHDTHLDINPPSH